MLQAGCVSTFNILGEIVVMRYSLIVAAALFAVPASAAPVIFTASGSNAAAVQSTGDGFRTAIGGINNGNSPGSQNAGRREVSWDGGGAAAPAATFVNPMTNFVPRGNVYTTPGSGFEISGQPAPEFADINATYADIFQPFSGARIFAPLGSTITNVHFTVPGAPNQKALTSAFGVIFSDVDFENLTGIEFFDISGPSLGTWFAPVASNGLSFLGVQFDSAIVADARIVTGNAALGPNDGGDLDVVAMDDFIYAEPAAAVPEPASWAMLIAGLALVGSALRRRPVAVSFA